MHILLFCGKKIFQQNYFTAYYCYQGKKKQEIISYRLVKDKKSNKLSDNLTHL